MLDEEKAMLRFLNTFVDPFDLLANAILVQAKHEDFTFNNTPKQTCSEEL